MNLGGVFIRRPVMATMLVAFLMVLGLFSYKSLGVDLFPNVDLPVVTVTTTLRGASPEEMEAQVTKPIELSPPRSCEPRSRAHESRDRTRAAGPSFSVAWRQRRPDAGR